MKLNSYSRLSSQPWQDSSQWPLNDLNWGLEKESIRLTQNGDLSLLPHPSSLNSLQFTRDFAENQLEIVTSIQSSPDNVYGQMEALVSEADTAIGNELLWPFSMPPSLPPDREIRPARFSGSKEAREATIYRQGLALRYGTKRQMISGLHVNVSIGDTLLDRLTAGPSDPVSKKIAKDNLYMALVRNLYRRLPLFYLLFSHAPFSDNDIMPEPSLSLRKSGQGYPTLAHYLDLDSLPAYTAKVREGLQTWSPFYAYLERIDPDNGRQLNQNILQNEKEFYVPIRIKAPVFAEEEGITNTEGLDQFGVGYLELRFPDIDPYEVAGISQSKLRLLQMIILSSLYENSPRFSAGELEELLRNMESLASSPLSILGRDSADDIEYSRSYLSSLFPVARQIDEPFGKGLYQQALIQAIGELQSVCRLPSSRLWQDFQNSKLSWTRFGLSRINQLKTVSHEYKQFCC